MVGVILRASAECSPPGVLPTAVTPLVCRRSNHYGGGGGFNVWISPSDFFFFTVRHCTTPLTAL